MFLRKNGFLFKLNKLIGDIVKLTNLTKCVLVVLVLASNAVNAEDQYPAANFEPKVVYQDESVAKNTEASAASKPSSTSSASSDSQYPASDFQPKVVYSDSDYKHTAPAVSASSSSSSESSINTSSSSAETPASAAVTPEKSDSSMGYLFGLIVLAAGGFAFFKKGKSGAKSDPKPLSANYASRAGSATGVARYVMRISGTGVSRYIDKNQKVAAATPPVSGVSKYLASRAVESEASASQSATGVEKYLRNKKG
jgi:hypothetical protein